MNLHNRPDTDSWRFLYGSWQGRVNRRSFWLYGVVALLGLALLLRALLDIAGVSPGRAELAVNLVLLWMSAAVSAKRWHDRDRSAWWVLLLLVPVVGVLWTLLDNGLVRGTNGPNRYGEAPPAHRA
jgi:uncharacterized membrane protein YhaH (DUF805 family)